MKAPRIWTDKQLTRLKQVTLKSHRYLTVASQHDPDLEKAVFSNPTGTKYEDSLDGGITRAMGALLDLDAAITTIQKYRGK